MHVLCSQVQVLPLTFLFFCFADLNSSDAYQQYLGAYGFKTMTSRINPVMIKGVVDTGILPRMLQLLVAGAEDARVQVALCLCNISGSVYARELVGVGAIPVLIDQILVAPLNVRVECILCLGNITGECQEFREAVMRAPRSIEALVGNISLALGNANGLHDIAFALGNICRGNMAVPVDLLDLLLHGLTSLLATGVEVVVAEACEAMFELTKTAGNIGTIVKSTESLMLLRGVIAQPLTKVRFTFMHFAEEVFFRKTGKFSCVYVCACVCVWFLGDVVCTEGDWEYGGH